MMKMMKMSIRMKIKILFNLINQITIQNNQIKSFYIEIYEIIFGCDDKNEEMNNECK